MLLVCRPGVSFPETPRATGRSHETERVHPRSDGPAALRSVTYAANGRSGGGRGHGVPSRGVSLHRCRSGGGLEDGLGDLLEDGLEGGLAGVLPAVAVVVGIKAEQLQLLCRRGTHASSVERAANFG